MVDRYTKAVLTVIAAALVGLFAQNLIPRASAVGNGCGDINSPCYISNFGALPITVRVGN